MTMRHKERERGRSKIAMRISYVFLFVLLFCEVGVFASGDNDGDVGATSLDHQKNVELGRVGRQAHRRALVGRSADLDDGGHHNHPKIEKFDFQCTNEGIQVNVEFDSSFNGVVYSRGHFPDPKCRYVEPNSGSRQSSFVVPSRGCGTEDLAGSLSNVLIFQMDEAVQEVWDTAKKISCKNTNKQVQQRKTGKMVVFKPLTVGMLDVQHHKMDATESLDCWMDIQKGAFPNTKPIGGLVEIGEELSVLIYIKDNERQYDISVKDCWAYDSEDFQNPKTGRVQLTDNDGCPRKKKLIGKWIKTFETGDSGATTIAFTNMTSFRFPNTDHVHLACNVELCKDQCEETCQTNVPGLPGQRPTPSNHFQPTTGGESPKLTNSRPQSPFGTQKPSNPGGYPQIRPRPATNPPQTQPSRCSPGSLDPRCISNEPVQSVTQTRPPLCYQGSTDQRCGGGRESPSQVGPTQTSRNEIRQPSFAVVNRQTTSRPLQNTQPPKENTPKLCYPGETRPDCPPDCAANPRDIRCRTEPAQPDCYPGSRNPACPQQTTSRPIQTQAPRQTQQSSTTQMSNEPLVQQQGCNSGSRNLSCASQTQRPVPTQPARTTTQQVFNTQRPVTPAVQRPTTPKLCYPGETRPDCPPDCKNNPRDTRCQQPDTHERCKPGSKEPACSKPTTARPIQTQPPRATLQSYQTTPSQYNPPPRPYPTASAQQGCYPGSKDQSCPQPSPPARPPQQSYQPTYRPPYQTTSLLQCYPGSRDPACSPQKSRPVQSQPTKPVTQPSRPPHENYQTTQKPQTTSKLCYPGETRPDCPPDCGSNPKDARCRQSSTLPNCFPGSRDPSCLQQTTQRPIQSKPERPTQQSYQTTQRPSQPTTQRCIPGSRDPACSPQTQPPRTPAISAFPTTQRPFFTQPPPQQTPSKLCYPGETRPDCPADCDANPKDIRCRKQTPTILTRPPLPNQPPRTPVPGPFPTRQPTFTQPPQRQTTSRQCYPGETRLDCPPDCNKNPKDTRCKQQSECTPGSTDPLCRSPQQQYQTSRRPVQRQTPRPTQQSYQTTQRPSIGCYPGSRDSGCAQPTQQAPQPEQSYQTSQRPYTIRPQQPIQTTPRPVVQAPQQQSRPQPCSPGEFRPDCSPDCAVNPNDARCRPSNTSKRCYAGSRDPSCPMPSTPRPIQTQPTRPTQQNYQTTARPFTGPPRQQTTAKLCYPGETRPDCPPDCNNNPRDIRCQMSTSPARCYSGSRDPSCQKQTTSRPIQTQPPIPAQQSDQTTQRPYNPPKTTQRPYPIFPAQQGCYPGSGDPICAQQTKPPRPPQQSYQTTRRPYTQPTSQRPYTQPQQTSRPTPKCYPGSRDPGCTQPNQAPQQSYQTTPGPFTQSPRQQTSTSKLCYPGETRPDCPPDCIKNPRDIRCNQPPRTTQRPYQPPTSQQRCHQGSRDPSCNVTSPRPLQTQPPRSTQQTYQTTQRPFTQSSYQTTTQPQCYPGSRDTACSPQITGRPIQTRPPQQQYQTTSRPYTQPPNQQTSPKLCYPGETRPDCPPDCKSNPRDIRCEKYPVAQKCYPGSRDPSCSTQTTRRPVQTQPPRPSQQSYQTTQHPSNPPQTTRKPSTQAPVQGCYPGSRDPSCNQSTLPPRPPQQLYQTTKKPYTQPPFQPPTQQGCYPGSQDNACSSQTTQRPIHADAPSPQQSFQTTRPFTQPPQPQSTVKLCYPGETRPDCPPDCAANPRDTRCNSPTSSPSKQTYQTTQRPYTRPTSERYTQSPYQPTTRQPYSQQPKQQGCYPGNRDPSCNSQSQRPIPTLPSRQTQKPNLTTQRPYTQPPQKQTTSKLCYPGETRPDCPTDCSANPRDIRCGQQSLQTEPPRKPQQSYQTTPRTNNPPQKNDQTTQFPFNQPTTQQRCYPGSQDPACSSQGLRPTQRPYSQSQPRPNTVPCYPGDPRPECPADCIANPDDSRCPKVPPSAPPSRPNCFPGSQDPRCIVNETPSTERPQTRPPLCYEGSTDPRCKSTQAPPQQRPPTRVSTSKPPICYPGQIDPRCPPVCDVEGVHDRRCKNEKN